MPNVWNTEKRPNCRTMCLCPNLTGTLLTGSLQWQQNPMWTALNAFKHVQLIVELCVGVLI